MDLSSRWDRYAAFFCLLLSVATMAGCGAVSAAGTTSRSSALIVATSNLNFGTAVVGSSKPLTDTITNRSAVPVTISSVSSSDPAFVVTGLSLPLTLAPGQSAIVTVTFKPQAVGRPGARLLITSNATTGGTIRVALSGSAVTAGALQLSPTSMAFGTVAVGQSAAKSATLKNSGGTSVIVSNASVSSAEFKISGLTLPKTLAAGQSTTFTVTFAPQSSGAASGSVSVTGSASLTSGSVSGSTDNTASTSASLPLAGDAVGSAALSILPTNLGFGNVQVGTTRNQQATLSNTGSGSITVTAATATGAGFSISGLTFPLTLAAGQSSAFSVSFAPQSAGNVSGAVAFTSSTANANLTLSGTGTASGSLSATPATVSFGNIQVGTNQTQTVSLLNNSTTSVTISQASASGTGFNVTGPSFPMTLNPGQSTSLTATFAPAAAGNATGSIAVASNATNPSLSIALSGTGVTAGALASNPASIAFGSVMVGTTQSRTATLSNTGGSLLHISTATVSGAGFDTSGLNAPTTLNPGQSLTFSLTFTPQSSSTSTGALALTADGSVPNLSISLSGSGSTPGQLTLSPATVNFGSVTVGATQTQSGSLSASGAGVTVSSVASTNSEFTITGLTLPLTLNAGQSASYTLTFAPQASGAASAIITFTTNANNAPVTASLTGSGTPAPQHSVSLSWNASTSTVAGYNVYRGIQSGGPYSQLNGSPGAGTNYTDSSVQAGETYFYVVTAVDGAGTESVYSNQAQAVVPSP